MSRWWLLVLWLIYFISPIDLFPDVVPLLGRLEDLLILILGLLYWFVWKPRKIDSANRSESDFEGAKTSDQSSYDNAHNRWNQREETQDPYTILGITPSATMEEIKRAYRVQARRYHPDKVSHLGEEFQALAHKKFQEIQWAYEELLRKRGK
jgi:uncharacterized membrane protein YkvA (DUF1232 family)